MVEVALISLSRRGQDEAVRLLCRQMQRHALSEVTLQEAHTLEQRHVYNQNLMLKSNRNENYILPAITLKKHTRRKKHTHEELRFLEEEMTHTVYTWRTK